MSDTSSSKSNQKRGMEILMQQNAQLEREVARLCAELDEVTMGIQKKGYLYKWRDRDISFASKWGLRYFVLQKNTISYYLDEHELRPRRTIDLNGCTLRDEGVKRGGLYHIFSIYSKIHDEDDSDDSTDSRDSNDGILLLRLSTDNSGEAMLWINVLNHACNINKREHIQDVISLLDVNNIPSHLSKDSHIHTNIEDWENHDIDSITKENLPPTLMQRVLSSTKILQKSMSRQVLTGSGPSSPHPKGAAYSNNFSKEIDKLSDKNKSSDKKPPHVSKAFRASKSVHVKSYSSPLSASVRPTEISYRGFFNLGMIILTITHFRLILDNLFKYGVLLQLPWTVTKDDITGTYTQKWDYPQIGLSLLSWFISIFVSYFIEVLASKNFIRERYVIILNYITGILNLVVPCVWVWQSKRCHPIVGMIYLFESVVIWMKLISYSHVNNDVRTSLRLMKKQDKEHSHSASSQSLGGLSARSSNTDFDNNAKPNLTILFAEMEDLEPPFLLYPQNITLPNIFYFCLAPTLCYQLNYPRTKEIRIRYIFFILVRMLIVFGLNILVIEQYIHPNLIQSLDAMKNHNIIEIGLKLLKLSIPSTYVWLLSFYLFFHLWLNLLAEITRFGDRVFYKDWWNARSIETYWRLWNLPVHHWMLRHLYYPIIRRRVPKWIATLIVFTFSAAFHEIVISTPFRYFAFHAFFGMLLQVPLVMITKMIDRRFDNPLIGNVIFWLSFCIIGQPMGVLMYYYDIWKISQ